MNVNKRERRFDERGRARLPSRDTLS